MKNEYDYIVVGTGPAGCVLANRLAAAGNSVLIMEAGPNYDDDPAIKNYNGGAMMQAQKYFWSDTVAGSKNLKGQTMITGAGRLAGGGSSVNGEVYVRPAPFVLSNWEKLAGAQWSAEKVYARYERLEKFNGDATDSDSRGRDGDLNIRQTYPSGGALLQKLTTAMAEASNCPEIKDYNDPNTPLGPYQRLQVYQKPDGKRASAAVSFLDVAKTGENLTILYETTATKILFDENKRAISVNFIEKGESKTAKAAKKIIISAGLRSAKLLQLSGIGPREILENAGVEIIHDSPKVGQTLVNDADAHAIFMANPADVAELDGKDIGTYWRSGAFLPSPILEKNQPKTQRQHQFLFMDIGNNMLNLVMLNVNTKSRGTIKIQSADPLRNMLLDENFLAEPEDLEELKAAYKIYVKGMADALAKADSTYKLISPTPEEIADDAKLEDYIRANFIQNFHDQGANAMGISPDAAVNGWCEVNGVSDLLVADTSVIPYHMDGNPSACSYMIGETVAAHLLGEE